MNCRLHPFCQQRHDEERDDVDDLDHRVDGRTGGVLVGVTDGVAGDGGLVGIPTLAAMVAVLDVLLGVIPAPPPVVMEMATKMPVTMVPTMTPPSALGRG